MNNISRLYRFEQLMVFYKMIEKEHNKEKYFIHEL